MICGWAMKGCLSLSCLAYLIFLDAYVQRNLAIIRNKYQQSDAYSRLFL